MKFNKRDEEENNKQTANFKQMWFLTLNWKIYHSRTSINSFNWKLLDQFIIFIKFQANLHIWNINHFYIWEVEYFSLFIGEVDVGNVIGYNC